METKVRKRSAFDIIRGHLLSIIFFIVIFALFLYGVSSAKASSSAEGKQVLEESVQKAVVSCYALAGAYPSSLDYLEENYGLTYDKDRYVINYSAWASNIYPEIDIIDLEEETEDTTE